MSNQPSVGLLPANPSATAQSVQSYSNIFLCRTGTNVYQLKSSQSRDKANKANKANKIGATASSTSLTGNGSVPTTCFSAPVTLRFVSNGIFYVYQFTLLANADMPSLSNPTKSLPIVGSNILAGLEVGDCIPLTTATAIITGCLLG